MGLFRPAARTQTQDAQREEAGYLVEAFVRCHRLGVKEFAHQSPPRR